MSRLGVGLVTVEIEARLYVCLVGTPGGTEWRRCSQVHLLAEYLHPRGETQMKPKEEAILDRIKTLEEAITKGREYLESGAHADWTGSSPCSSRK